MSARWLKRFTAGFAGARAASAFNRRSGRADSCAVPENVDRRLLAHFERSWSRQREARLHLPRSWLEDERPAAQQLNEIFLDLMDRARDRIDARREELRLRSQLEDFD
jgi:hypothetical protein